jgi:hypothetical protein
MVTCLMLLLRKVLLCSANRYITHTIYPSTGIDIVLTVKIVKEPLRHLKP